MRSLADPGAADALIARVRRLSPDGVGRWGTMSCPQMVAHVADACRLYLGDLPSPFEPSLFQYPPLKQLIVYVLPFPKNVKTSPVLLARRPGPWETEIDALCEEIARVAAACGGTTWPIHPIFGRLSPRAWGVMAWRHTDHHLRQFGV